jgi:hypothetical protein
MVATKPGEISYLNASDYRAMDVVVVPPRTATLQPAPAPSPAPVTAAFADGRRDRLALEEWVNTLTGEAYAGAQYWASVRNDPGSRSCDAPGQPPFSLWVAGCLAARAKLTPLDARRNSEPDYKAGWNQASSELQAGATSAPARSTSAAFADGRRDRLALQQWVNSLTGYYHDGAEWWAEVRSNPNHGDCVSVGLVGDWVQGCVAAKAKLDPFDARRKAEPDYKAGWNQASSELQAKGGG